MKKFFKKIVFAEIKTFYIIPYIFSIFYSLLFFYYAFLNNSNLLNEVFGKFPLGIVLFSGIVEFLLFYNLNFLVFDFLYKFILKKFNSKKNSED